MSNCDCCNFEGSCACCTSIWDWLKKWIRVIAMVVYLLILLAVLPTGIIWMSHMHADPHAKAWFVGGIFVMAGFPISLWSIFSHLHYYTNPDLQKPVIRILFMVPIYAWNAWFALRFPHSAIYLDTLRECYEAYVVWSFMTYLMRYLGATYPDFKYQLAEKPQQKHLVPFCCLTPWPMGRAMVENCRYGVIQYVVVRPATTILAFISTLTGIYGEGDFNFKSSYTYLTIINNLSGVWAVYCLVLFYKVAREELAPIDPLWKFMAVKSVVFVAFWQSVAIAMLVALGVINKMQITEKWGVHEVAAGLQDLCICIEMFPCALGFLYAFSYRPFMAEPATVATVQGTGSTVGNMFRRFGEVLDLSEVNRDVNAFFRNPSGYRASSAGEGRPLLSNHNSTDLRKTVSSTAAAANYIEMSSVASRAATDSFLTAASSVTADDGQTQSEGAASIPAPSENSVLTDVPSNLPPSLL